jgi:FMN-dependent NADH-azoreductase
MKTLLQINSSLNSDQGQSSKLARQFVEKWRQANPQGRIVLRDLAANPLPHLSAERFKAFTTKPEERSAEQAAQVAESDALVAELKLADVVVIGLPMYNFGIPSTLKAWIDHIARAGQTFKYTANGPVGLVPDTKAVLIAARGGQYEGTPSDTQTGYMLTLLNFIGISDIDFVYAEGLAMGDEIRQQSLTTALDRLDSVLAA